MKNLIISTIMLLVCFSIAVLATSTVVPKADTQAALTTTIKPTAETARQIILEMAYRPPGTRIHITVAELPEIQKVFENKLSVTAPEKGHL